MAKLKITLIEENGEKYFYYPDESCKTRDGGMRMLMSYLNNKNGTSKLKIKMCLIK